MGLSTILFVVLSSPRLNRYKYIMINLRSDYTLWLFNIAMENGPFIDGLPINSMVIFHGYVSHNQMVLSLTKTS
jgi:hypothetical protein